jgi:hypothetical protein
MIEVTIPLTVRASMTFHVDDASEVTPELINSKINTAQHHLDHQGDDAVTGIYLTIDGQAGEAEIYDREAEARAYYEKQFAKVSA